MDVVLILYNIRSCYNVGAILRTAEGLGVKEVVFAGYTPRIHDSRVLPHLREKLDREIHKTALGAEEYLRIKNAEKIKALLSDYKEQGFRIIGLENNVKEKLYSISDPNLSAITSDKCVLILGEEVKGISLELYDFIDYFVEIPMKGKKESLNVSVAAGIALYAIMKI